MWVVPALPEATSVQHEDAKALGVTVAVLGMTTMVRCPAEVSS